MAAPADTGAHGAPVSLRTLVERYDPQLADVGERSVRIRLEATGEGAWDLVVSDHGRSVALELASGSHAPDASLSADRSTWDRIEDDVRGGMEAFEAGRLAVRRDLHLGVGFLAATSAMDDERRLKFHTVRTRRGRISALEAGDGPPVIALHGLGATKASFLPTVAAMAEDFRVIAIDLPGFGDSGKPLRAAYDAPFFAEAVVDLLDALELDAAHLVGNSMGGRVALEVGMRAPERVGRLGLLAPSLAWRRDRGWAPLLKLVRPELGAIQPAPRPVVEAIVQRVIPGAADGWTAAGVDEFLRSYLTARGRAAFYAAARNIYLEEPFGREGFWPRLKELASDSLFVWGTKDQVVPIGFARHVTETLPFARHLELRCGHVPQLEKPKQTHDALTQFLKGHDPT